jgi:hypothetical protein
MDLFKVKRGMARRLAKLPISLSGQDANLCWKTPVGRPKSRCRARGQSFLGSRTLVRPTRYSFSARSASVASYPGKRQTERPTRVHRTQVEPAENGRIDPAPPLASPRRSSQEPFAAICSCFCASVQSTLDSIRRQIAWSMRSKKTHLVILSGCEEINASVTPNEGCRSEGLG